jgi:hypothetical protein
VCRRWAVALAWACLPAPAVASEEPAASPQVGIDQLLKLPSSVQVPPGKSARRGGHTRDEWRERFEDARGEIDEHRAALDRALAELKEMVGEQGSWQMAAPGMPAAAAEDTPVSYQLREEIRRERVEMDRAEKRLRELEVEASLAGVPPEWVNDGAEEGTPPR